MICNAQIPPFPKHLNGIHPRFPSHCDFNFHPLEYLFFCFPIYMEQVILLLLEHYIFTIFTTINILDFSKKNTINILINE